MTTTDYIRPALIGMACAGLGAAAVAAPVTYEIDPAHTYPAFEADHLGGMSYWRGKINSTSGSVTLDMEEQSGSVDVTMDMDSIDFGHDGLNAHAKTADMFDVAQFPTATFTGRLADFVDGSPTKVEGTLTMHGVSQPVTLDINRFVCRPNPMNQRPMCGADAIGEIDRSDFGVSYGQPVFHMGVTLRISIEAIAPRD